MIDVCLLGTGGMMPMPERYLSSMMIRYKGRLIMVDCGEGTQVTLKEKGWGFKAIDAILFTHYHADHISGLPGMLLAIANAKREEPLKLIGPKGLVEVVTALRTIASELTFPIEFIVLDDNNEDIIINEISVKYAKAEHSVDCVSYRFDLLRPGKFNVKAAEALDLPRNYWSQLQKGENIKYNGKLYTPSMVMGDTREGISISYCTDSRPYKGLADFARNSDLFICEGMYGSDEKRDKAELNKHMLFSEAAKTALEANVKLLWLTHFSPALSDPEEYSEAVKEIFNETVVGHDRMSASFYFDGRVVYTD